MKAPFPINAQLTAVAVAYRNATMIADAVLPRIPVAPQAFKYMKYPVGEMFSPPDTEVGRKGKPNTVEFTGTETTDSTVDQALDDEVPQADIDNARESGLPDPLMRAAQGITNLLELRREVRAAKLVFNAATFGTNNKVQLSGTSQWSDYTNSNPIAGITGYLDSCLMRPRIAVFGRSTFTKLSQHPKICKAVFGNNTDAGIVTRQNIAALFELEEVVVGEGWVNTAKKGQPVSMVRVWGKHAAFLYRDRQADPMGQVTFGFTAQWKGRVAGSWEDKDIGAFGGTKVRVAESVKEVSMANDLGFFVEDAVA